MSSETLLNEADHDCLKAKQSFREQCKKFESAQEDTELEGILMDINKTWRHLDYNRERVHKLQSAITQAAPRAQGVTEFKELLPGPVDDHVVAMVSKYLPKQLSVANTAEAASEIYNMAERLPQTSTRLKVKEEHNIIVNGPFKPDGECRSLLLYAFSCDSNKPLLLKLPRGVKASTDERTTWKQISAGATQDELRCLVGPISEVNIEGHPSLNNALCMPLYPATLAHVPKPMDTAGILKVGRQVKSALCFMHSHGMCHNDVKAPNIFLDYQGNAHLGDLGSARITGADSDERTWSFIPSDLGEGLNPFVASPVCDFMLLAITLLQQVDLLRVAKGANAYTCGEVRQATENVKDELKEFINQLLPEAIWRSGNQ